MTFCDSNDNSEVCNITGCVFDVGNDRDTKYL